MTLYARRFDVGDQPITVQAVESDDLREIWPGAYVDVSGTVPGPVLDRLYTTAAAAWYGANAYRWPAPLN